MVSGRGKPRAELRSWIRLLFWDYSPAVQALSCTLQQNMMSDTDDRPRSVDYIAGPEATIYHVVTSRTVRDALMISSDPPASPRPSHGPFGCICMLSSNTRPVHGHEPVRLSGRSILPGVRGQAHRHRRLPLISYFTAHICVVNLPYQPPQTTTMRAEARKA